MRGVKSFAGLLLILVGLGAYLYFVESRRTPGDDDAREKVFSVEADAIEAITVRAESGARTTLRKSGADWQIVEPESITADAGEVASLTSGLASLEIQRVLEENATSLDQFGLDSPRFDVSFTAGGQERKVLFGAKTPVGSDLYARLDNESRVFLVPAHVEATFNQTTFDLRDKRVLRVDRDAIEAVDVAGAGTSLSLAKKDAEWMMTRPVAAPADFSAVSGLVSRLTSAQMQSIADAPPAATGLATPAATVTVGAGDTRTTLRFGSAAADGSVYAQEDSRPEIFTVEASLLDDLKKAPASYRQKDLFDARVFNTTRLEITRAGQTVAYERAAVKNAEGVDEQKWRKVQPSAGEVDGGTIDAFVAEATSAQAAAFVDDTRAAGLDRPELTVAITYDNGKQDRVSFARAGATVYVSRAGMAGAATIDQSVFDSILTALDGIK